MRKIVDGDSMKEILIAILAAAGIPSACMGTIVWMFKRHIDRREMKKEEQDKNTEKMILLIAQNSRATYTLAKATAQAVQRIPDANCNGDMTSALADAESFQLKEQQLLIDQGIKRIFGE